MSLDSNALHQSFTEVKANASRFTEAFFRNLFERSPEFAKLFRWIDMTEQRLHFMSALERIVECHADPARLAAFVEPLGHRHARYGATAPQFQLFGEVLLQTLRQTLKDRWDAPVENAWIALYRDVVQIMMGHAALAPEVRFEASAPAKFGIDPVEKKREERVTRPASPPSLESEALHEVALLHARKLLAQALEEEVARGTFRASVESAVTAAIAALVEPVLARLTESAAARAREICIAAEGDTLAQMQTSIGEKVQRLMRETVEHETSRILRSMTKSAA